MSKIEGMPEGWELVRIGVPKDGEWYIGFSGHPEQAQSQYDSVLTIISKTEKPKQYRPFANAAEFAPHRDRWIQRSSKLDTKDTLPAGCFRVVSYNDHHVWTVDAKTISYKQMLEEGKTFDDGSPFGVEVQS